MWSRVWVLAALAASAAVTATNDVFPVEEEPDAPPPLPHASTHHRSHNEVFPLKEEDLDVPRVRHTSTHHKVHNIVLHPQNSMCELKPIRQIVTHALCTSKEMENNVCVGTCFSYTVPQTEPETPGDELLDYCDSCQASESHWTTIQMDCEEYGNTYQVTKKIQMITNCSCSACHPKGQQPTTDNEVTYPANEPRVSESFYKMLPQALQQRTDLNELMHTPIVDLRNSYSMQPAFNTNEDEEDPNVVVLLN